MYNYPKSIHKPNKCLVAWALNDMTVRPGKLNTFFLWQQTRKHSLGCQHPDALAASVEVVRTSCEMEQAPEDWAGQATASRKFIVHEQAGCTIP